MSESTTQQRENWRAFECSKERMVAITFGPDRILVAPPTADAWAALANILLAHGYNLRTPDTDSYNCREIKGGGGRSLHSFGIALDINWDTNPYKETPNKRQVIFSNRATQVERAEDVRLGRADTDMTPAMIADVLAIKTNNGKTLFEWGGNWNSIKDTMHFEIDVTPADLATGINPTTVKMPLPGATWGTPRGGLVGDDAILGIGARGPRVEELQRALFALGIAVGEIDGIFGPATRSAVKAFQASKGLEQSGTADATTLRALGIAAASPRIAQDDKAADAVLEALLAALGLKPAPAPTPAPSPGTSDLLTGLITTLLGKTLPVPGAIPEAVKATQEVVLSPIDKMLGGAAMAGKKTPLAVIAYSLLSILQGVDVAGTATGATATPTGQILTTLITAFGGLGLLGKFDRAINILGLVAGAKQQSGGK